MLTGIREPELIDLADELLRVGPEADQLDMDLTTAFTQSGLLADAAHSVVRDIATDAIAVANHLRWIHDELSTFRIDHYLQPWQVVSVEARRLGLVQPGPPEGPLRQADADWTSQQRRPPIETRTRADLARVAVTVADELPNAQRRAIAMAMIHSGVPPSQAISVAREVALDGPHGTSGIDHHLIASQVLVEFAEDELIDPRYGDLHHSRIDLDTSPTGRPARAAVALAQFTKISVGDAARQIAAAITLPPWEGLDPSQAYSPAEALRITLVQKWVDVLIDAPANARPIDLSQLLLEQVPGSNLAQAIGLVAMAENPLRVGFSVADAGAIQQFALRVDPGVLDAVSDYAHDLRGQISQIASTGGLLSGALRPPALAAAVGGAAKYVNMSLMVDAWVDGDTAQLTELVTDSLSPTLAKFIVSRFLPAVAGPIGFFLAAILIITTSEGPKNDQPHRPPKYGHVNEYGQTVQVVFYANPAGVPDMALRKDVSGHHAAAETRPALHSQIAADATNNAPTMIR